MAGISLSDFFRTQRDVSEIKTEFLTEYFKAWAAIILKGQQYKKINKILYVDLFSGPGRYSDGTPSTPLKILSTIYNSKGNSFIDYDRHVQTIFNDKDELLFQELQTNVSSLPFYNDLTFKPIISQGSANLDILKNALKEEIPSLTFIDPLGYGFTQKMLMYSVKRWGSDLFLLFNFNRIRAAISNGKVENNMVEIFGDYLQNIQEYYNHESSPRKREVFIIDIFEKIFEEKGFMTLKFRINFPDKNQTSHYLFFVSKVELAITRAKEIMSKYSDYQEDGIPLFGANLNYQPLLDPDLNSFSINKLSSSILNRKEDFHLKTIEEIYKIHNYRTNYIKDNYKRAIENLLNGSLINLLDSKNLATKRVTYTAKVKFS